MITTLDNHVGLAPKNEFTYGRWEELYLTIMEKRGEEEQIRILQEEIGKETSEIIHQKD